jgi:hypothetical protein
LNFLNLITYPDDLIIIQVGYQPLNNNTKIKKHRKKSIKKNLGNVLGGTNWELGGGVFGNLMGTQCNPIFKTGLSPFLAWANCRATNFGTFRV